MHLLLHISHIRKAKLKHNPTHTHTPFRELMKLIVGYLRRAAVLFIEQECSEKDWWVSAEKTGEEIKSVFL